MNAEISIDYAFLILLVTLFLGGYKAYKKRAVEVLELKRSLKTTSCSINLLVKPNLRISCDNCGMKLTPPKLLKTKVATTKSLQCKLSTFLFLIYLMLDKGQTEQQMPR